MHPVYMCDENGEIIEIKVNKNVKFKGKKNKDNFIVQKKKVEDIKKDFKSYWNHHNKGGAYNE